MTPQKLKAHRARYERKDILGGEANQKVEQTKKERTKKCSPRGEHS